MSRAQPCFRPVGRARQAHIRDGALEAAERLIRMLLPLGPRAALGWPMSDLVGLRPLLLCQGAGEQEARFDGKLCFSVGQMRFQGARVVDGLEECDRRQLPARVELVSGSVITHGAAGPL